MLTVVTKEIPSLTHSGRHGRKRPHVILLDGKGRRLADTEINKRTDVEAVKAKYQRIADNHNRRAGASQ